MTLRHHRTCNFQRDLFSQEWAPEIPYDGGGTVRLLLPKMFFDADRCADGLEALRQYRTDYDEKTRAFKDTPKHDWSSHSADAMRYCAMAYREYIAPKEEPKKPLFKGLDEMTMAEWIREDDEIFRRRSSMRI